MLRRCFSPAALVATLLAIAAPNASAKITPDAAKVVNRYIAATGVRVDADRSIHTKSTITTSGFTGTIESWVQKPYKMVSRTTLGPFTMQEGYDGTIGWEIDQNGKLSIYDGKDLENVKGTAWLANAMWLAPDQGGGSIKVLSQEKDSTGAWTVLEVTPPIGRAYGLWFNEKSGLCDRVVTEDDTRISTTTRISDYRMEAGALRPHHHETSDGTAANDISRNIDSIWVNQPIAASRFSPPQPTAPDFMFLKGSPAKLPMRYEGKHIWLKVSVDGSPPEDFLLDSGASGSLLDSGWAARHGITSEGRIQAVGAGGTGDVAFAKVGSIEVASPDGNGVKLKGLNLAVSALNFAATLAPVGILGCDFFSRFVVAIDYDNQTLTLNDPKTFTYAGKGTAVPITFAHSIPVGHAKLDRQYEGEFVLDVGAGQTVDIHVPYVKKNGLREKLVKKIEVVRVGFGGMFSGTAGRMRLMEIGPYSWNDPLVILSGAESGGDTSEDYAGTIGNGIFERFICTFDFEHRKLYLEPGKRYLKADGFSRAGVWLAKVGGAFRAIVLPGSPAALAGIQPGDEVVIVDGKPILRWTLDSIDRMFEQGAVGEKHTLEIVRGGKKQKVSLTLKDIL